VDAEVLSTRRRRNNRLKKLEKQVKAPEETWRRLRLNLIELTDCQAKMVVTLKNGKWVLFFEPLRISLLSDEA
jgi:hypothetical protein